MKLKNREIINENIFILNSVLVEERESDLKNSVNLG